VSEALDWPLLAARFVLLTLGVGMFGRACFDLYAPASVRREAPAAIRVLAPLAATVAGLVWIAALGGEVSGEPGLASPAVIATLCTQTLFGQALGAAVLFALASAGLALAPRRPARVRAALAGALLVSLAFVGHVAGGPGGPSALARIGVMALHLLAAGVWLGGLLPLALALPGAGPDTVPLLREFGRVALAAVAVLATSGMIVAMVVFTLARGAAGGTYLSTFGVKLGLVVGMLALASLNRWRLTPLAERDPAAGRRAFAWSVAAEQALALAILATVTLLGQTDPAM
jgi:putative copper export protein